MEQRRREAAKDLLKHSLFGFQAHDAVVSERLGELKDLLLATCGEKDQIALLSENIREIEEQLKNRSERFLLESLRCFEQDMELLLDVGSGDDAEEIEEDSDDDLDMEELTTKGKAVEAWQQGRDAQHVFTEGEVVEVLARDWRGINKPGGVARVRSVEVVQKTNGGKDVFYDVVHIVGAFKEKRLPAKFVRRYKSSDE
ncbi:Major Facilitator Superfamily (MFS) [Phytophthora nicotianae]|uniref:Major Facilitator Superfamily (MFS) n=1 Tax=Phytophthora nicotianae TaxID=4792 RepID=A0A0W8DRD6_PHYNI|nr:Major Facilitator Superfamily (MFS) [Phytophthora nicotianae]